MNNFLKAITVKQETVKIESIGQDVTIQQLTMNQSDEIEILRQKVIKGEAKDNELIIQSCRYAMVEPICPSDEELRDMSQLGFQTLVEIYMAIPMIGMGDEEKEDYKKKVVESISNEIKKIVSQEEIEKK